MFDGNLLPLAIPPEIAARLQQPCVTWFAFPDEYGRGFSPVAYDAKGKHIVTLDHHFPNEGVAIDYVWAMTGRQ